MSNRRNLPQLLLLTVICFLLGLASVWLRDFLSTRPGLTSTPTASSPSRNATPAQRIVLVVGVDQVEGDSPSLRAVWYVTYRPPGKQVFLLGLPVDARPSPASPSQLQTVFGWSAESGLSQDFLDSLAAIIPFAPDASVVLDEHGFAALIDYTGGITMEGARLDGAEITALLSMLQSDPSASLSTQSQVLKALCAQASSLGTTPDLTPLISLIPSHAWISVDVSSLVALGAPLLPLEPELIHVDVY